MLGLGMCGAFFSFLDSTITLPAARVSSRLQNNPVELVEKVRCRFETLEVDREHNGQSVGG